MSTNERINHAIGRIERGAVLIAEETARGDCASSTAIEYIGKWVSYWEDERDRLIDELVDEHQADLEDWSSRIYSR